MPKVLIIEDNDLSLRLLRDAFRNDQAWNFIFATDGVHGLELALQHLSTLNAIVLDVFLPRLDGRHLLEVVRKATSRLPIIAISGDMAALEDMKSNGATIALPKPVSGERFAEVLRAIIPSSNGVSVSQAHQSDAFSFDRTPVPRMQTLDLDTDRVNQHIRAAVERRRYDGPLDWQDFLLSHGGLIEDSGSLRPTIAGALVFASRPERWLIANGIDIAEFAGEQAHSTNIRLQQPIRGNVFAIIERTVDLLWARIDHATTLDSEHGVTQVQTDAYPHIVLRELTINALCHRDWSQEGAVVRIQIFPNRIEWISPGGLPPGLIATIEGLRHSQVARNPALAQLLYQAGAIERFGLGLDTVFDTLHAHGHPPPEMIDHSHSFVVRVFAKPITDPPHRRQLTERQQRIQSTLIARGELTAMELAQELGEPLRNIQRDLQDLLAGEEIGATGQTRNRRYRVIRNGMNGAK